MGSIVQFDRPTDLRPPTPLKLSTAIADFLQRYRGHSRHTYKNFSADLKRLHAELGEQPVAHLSREKIRRHLEGLQRRDGRPLAPQSHNRHFATLHRFFAWLVDEEELAQSPMEKLERRKVGERLPRPMSSEQIDAFFSQVDNLRDRTLFSLLHGSGLRIGEALSLDIQDVHLSKGTFRVVGKGDRERSGYLSERTIKLLRRYPPRAGTTKGRAAV